MKVMATASLMLLGLLSGCTSGAFAPTTTGGPASLEPNTTAAAVSSPSATPAAESPPARTTSPSVSPHASFDLPDGPPPVTVRTGDTSFNLPPWTYCYGPVCADGMPPSDPADIGEARRVQIEFPLDGWTFQASFVPVDVPCPRRQTVSVEKTGEHTYVLEPAGPANTYEVTLFGRGDGDLVVTFVWTTPHDGPMPVPEARLAVLADRNGTVDSYGVELSLQGLRATPTSASAEVTVTAANGRSLSFEAVPARARGCQGEGVVYWNGPDGAGLRAAKLGPAPFTYDVVVVLDGVRYAASAAWPADEIEDYAPSVELEFSPPLPAVP